MYNSINVEGPIKKIEEINQNLINANNPRQLSQPQLTQLFSLLKSIGNTAFYHNTNFTQNETQTLTHVLTNWSNEELIPILDTYRMFLIHPRSNDIFNKLGGGMQDYTILLEKLKNGPNVQIILALRNLNNFFNNETSRLFITEKRQSVLDTASVHLDSENKLIRSAFASLLYK